MEMVRTAHLQPGHRAFSLEVPDRRFDSMKALADGLAVSLAIERYYLKTGGMNEPFRKEGTLLKLQTNGIERADRWFRQTGNRIYGRGDARDHALPGSVRVMPVCVPVDLMRLHEKTPRRLYEEFT